MRVRNTAIAQASQQQSHSPEPLHSDVAAGGGFRAGIDSGGGSNAAKMLAPTSGRGESLGDGAGMESHQRGATDEIQKPAAKQPPKQFSFASSTSCGLSLQPASESHGKTADVLQRNKKDSSESVLQERNPSEPTSTLQPGKALLLSLQQEHQQQPESQASQAETDGSMLQVAGNENAIASLREEEAEVARLSRELFKQETVMRSLLATTHLLQTQLGLEKIRLQDFVADDHVSNQENESLPEAGRLSRELVKTEVVIESLLVTIRQLRQLQPNLGDEKTSLQDAALSDELENKEIVIGSLLETILDLEHDVAQKTRALDSAHGAHVRLAHRHEIHQRMNEEEVAHLRGRVYALENGAGDDMYAGFTFDYGSDTDTRAFGFVSDEVLAQSIADPEDAALRNEEEALEEEEDEEVLNAIADRVAALDHLIVVPSNGAWTVSEALYEIADMVNARLSLLLQEIAQKIFGDDDQFAEDSDSDDQFD